MISGFRSVRVFSRSHISSGLRYHVLSRQGGHDGVLTSTSPVGSVAWNVPDDVLVTPGNSFYLFPVLKKNKQTKTFFYEIHKCIFFLSNAPYLCVSGVTGAFEKGPEPSF